MAPAADASTPTVAIPKTAHLARARNTTATAISNTGQIR